MMLKLLFLEETQTNTHNLTKLLEDEVISIQHENLVWEHIHTFFTKKLESYPTSISVS